MQVLSLPLDLGRENLTFISTSEYQALTNKLQHLIITLLIATVWLANGLLCKVLNLVPRHELIVARILGNSYSRLLTILIGLSEIIMAIWTFTKFKSKLNAIVQMTIVATMNAIEFILAPDLLLWGKLNALYAFLFILLVYYNEFVLNKQLKQAST